QRDAPAEAQAGKDEKSDPVGQPGGCPGRTLKEGVVAIEAVALGMIRRRLGLRRMGGATEGVFTQAHDPTPQQLAGRAEGRLGERAGQNIDDVLEGVYHDPHGGTSLSLRPNTPSKIGGTPFAFTLPRPSNTCAFVHLNLRKSRYGRWPIPWL